MSQDAEVALIGLGGALAYYVVVEALSMTFRRLWSPTGSIGRNYPREIVDSQLERGREVKWWSLLIGWSLFALMTIGILLLP